MALPRDCLELLQEQKSRNTTSLAIRKNRRIPALPEQFFDRFAGIACRGRNVLEPAAKRIIVAHSCVVDPERGIDRGGDIFGIDGTLFRPSRIVDVECIGRGFAQRAPSAYPSARDKCGMNEVMVPALPVCNVSDRASEFALDDD